MTSRRPNFSWYIAHTEHYLAPPFRLFRSLSVRVHSLRIWAITQPGEEFFLRSKSHIIMNCMNSRKYE